MTKTENTIPARLLLVGATGVVGQHVLQQALSDARVGRVVALTRRPLPAHPKLDNHVVDFAQWSSDAPWWKVDAVICTLGTTIKLAGSQAAFARVDRDLPVEVARLARSAGATRFVLNSSVGASPDASFYLRTKAEAEAQIRAVDFPGYTIVRPSLIDADRAESRPGERFAIWIARALRPLIPARYRAVRPEQIARALLEAALSGGAGESIIESEQIDRPSPVNAGV